MKVLFGTLALGAGALLVGCNSAPMDTAQLESISEAEQALSTGCNDGQMFNSYKASLAVAMAREMGRIDTLVDLVKTSSGAAISSTGLARCSANGKAGCPNTQAILDLQKSEVNNMPGGLDQGIFPANSFRSDLIASFDRQKNNEVNLAQNYPSRMPGDHSLSLKSSSFTTGMCGDYYTFFATSLDGKNIDNIKERLVFFGGSDNPFLAFSSTLDTISIDPTATMNGDTSSSTLTCTAACTSTNLSLLGACCSCSGKTGKFATASWSKTTLVCVY